MKITSNIRKNVVSARSIKSSATLRRELKEILDEDLCVEVVNIGYSNDDEFADAVFIEAEVFWDIHSNDDAFELVKHFYDGENLDSNTSKSANPNSEYFRQDKYEDVESTNYPGDIYMDEILDDIINYIIDHQEDRTFPEEIEDILKKFREDSEED